MHDLKTVHRMGMRFHSSYWTGNEVPQLILDWEWDSTAQYRKVRLSIAS